MESPLFWFGVGMFLGNLHATILSTLLVYRLIQRELANSFFRDGPKLPVTEQRIPMPPTVEPKIPYTGEHKPRTINLGEVRK